MNDIERRNGPYFALFRRIFVFDVVVIQLLGPPHTAVSKSTFNSLYDRIKTICALRNYSAIIWAKQTDNSVLMGAGTLMIDYMPRLGLVYIFIVEIRKSVQWA